MNNKYGRALALAGLCLTLPNFARGDDLATYEVLLKDHKFTPSELQVPAGKPFFVHITNSDDVADEFEMVIPAVERTLQAGQDAKVKIKPLGAGHFAFFGESDPDNERGVIISQ